jgi:hypothetical protein
LRAGDIVPSQGRWRSLLGPTLAMVGTIALLAGVLGLDPTSKMADDGDPFGKEPTPVAKSVPFAAALAAFGGSWLILRSRRTR